MVGSACSECSTRLRREGRSLLPLFAPGALLRGRARTRGSLCCGTLGARRYSLAARALTATTALLSTTVLLVHSGPGTALGFFGGHSFLLIALFDLFGFPYLLFGVSAFVSAWHGWSVFRRMGGSCTGYEKGHLEWRRTGTEVPVRLFLHIRRMILWMERAWSHNSGDHAWGRVSTAVLLVMERPVRIPACWRSTRNERGRDEVCTGLWKYADWIAGTNRSHWAIAWAKSRSLMDRLSWK